MENLLKIDQKQNLKQSCRLIMARYSLSLREQRMIIALCSQIKEDEADFSVVRVKAAELAKFCLINGHDKYKVIKETLLKLMTRTLQIQRDNGEWYATHWLQSAEYIGDGIIEYCLDKSLKDELRQIKSSYVSAPAAALIEFKREYSVRFYFILKQKLKNHCLNFDLDLDFLRDRLQLRETYKQISNIKDVVIEPSLAEINEKSDLQVKHKYLKTKRNITGIHFSVAAKVKKKKASLTTAQIEIVKQLLQAGEKTLPPPPKLLPPPPKEAPPEKTPEKQEEIIPILLPASNAPVIASELPTEPPKKIAPSILPETETKPSETITEPLTAKKTGDLPTAVPTPTPPPEPLNLTSMPNEPLLSVLIKSPWNLAKPIAQKLINRYGEERIRRNIAYAETNNPQEYSPGSWLLHCIVSDR